MCQSGPAWHYLSALLIGGAAGCAGEAPRSTTSPLGTTDSGVRATAPPPDAALPGRSEPAPVALIPSPKSMTACDGTLVLDTRTEIVIDDDARVRAIGVKLGDWLGVGATRVRAIPRGAPGPARAIVLRLEASATPERDAAASTPSDTEDEAFTLDVSPETAVVRAKHPAGLFYGAQTVAQLAGVRPLSPLLPAPAASRSLPCVHIEDAPTHRFRAMHLDVARHFFDKTVVERYLDILAFYRINVFHWHLTDDQGFRLTIRSHPELTQIGGKRTDKNGNQHAGSYTQEEAREVVAFAKERFVTVIPEIEMPGHARAILAAHPELSCTGKKQDVPSTWGVFEDVLCAGNEGTFTLLGDVLRETTEVFPSKLVHVGGDEVPKVRWNACPKCRARMAKEKLNAEQLQGAFMKRTTELLASHGRRVAAWDESLDGGLPKDGVVFAWQGMDRGALAARRGHDVVFTPVTTTYFNFWQSRAVANHPGHDGDLPWTKVIDFDPTASGIEPAHAARVLGGGGTLWTEHVLSSSDIDTLLLPRLAALSEVLWRARGDQVAFGRRFAAQRPMLDASGVQYFVEPPAGLKPKKIFLETATVAVTAPTIHPDGVVRYTLDGSEPNATSPIFTRPIELRATTAVAARLFLSGGRKSDVVRGTVEKTGIHATVQPSMSPEMLRPGVRYEYFELPETHALPDFTKLTPTKNGRRSALSFDPSFRKERFAVVYDAWLRAPEEGVFRFVAKADDGVAVDVDGVRVLIDDGDHAPRDADGEIALARGPHTVRITYYQGGGGKTLELQCEGPGLALGACPLVSP